jgi:putative MATE family efflux protein
MPANMLYNFGAGILRSQGDTKNPMIYLTISGFLNVILNAIFLIVFDMTVDGVAWATVSSQYLSAILIISHLFRTSEWTKLELSKMRITVSKMKKIIRIGIPAGFQSFLFSCGNVVVQSSVNSFGGDFIAGNTAAQNIEGFIWMAMNSFQHTALTFVGQHIGAKKVDKLPKIIGLNVLFVTLTGVFTAAIAIIFRYPLLGLYLDEASIIETAIDRMFIIAGSYFLCGIMDVLTGTIRGIGNSIVPMVLTVGSVCGVRIVWVFTVFKLLRDTDYAHMILYSCYPLSWLAAVAAMAVAVVVLYKKLKKNPIYAECFVKSGQNKKNKEVVNEA